MKFKFETVKNKIIELKDPYMVSINKEEETPADDLTAIFPIDKKFDEFRNVEVFLDDVMIFSGVIDEQITEVSDSGLTLKIYARNKAALLIDNEALPQTYQNPSLKIIFDRHIKKYGFSELRGDNKAFTNTFTVSKGMSEWDVLKEYCSTYLNTVPIVIDDYIIDATSRNYNKSNTILSNNDNGIRYFGIKEDVSRYNLISEVFVRTGKDAAYDTRITDESALINGVERKRYLNFTNDKRTPVALGEQIIKNGKRKYKRITAECIGLVPFVISQKVRVSDNVLGDIDNLNIIRINYQLDSSGEKTKIVMIKGEE